MWTVWDRETLCFHSFSEFSQTFISVSITQEKSSNDHTRENCFRLFTKTLQGNEGEIIFIFLVSKRKVSLVAPSLRHQLVLDLVVIQSTELYCCFLLTVFYWMVYSKKYNINKLKAKITL